MYFAPFAVPTALVWWGQRKAKAHRKADKPILKAVHEQVQNSHSTNLREDIDEIRDLVKGGFSKVDRRLDGLQEELRTERLERIAGDNRLSVNVHPVRD